MFFEPIKIDMIGLGGQVDDKPLVDEINDMLTALAQEVTGPRVVDKATATLTVKLTVASTGGNGIAIIPDLTVRPPKYVRRALAGFISEQGELLTAEHRQTALDLEGNREDENDNVRRISERSRANGEDR